MDKACVSDAVAAEVRAELARKRISRRDAARQLGWTSQYMHRRASGETPFDAVDLFQLARLLGVKPGVFFPAEVRGEERTIL
jgi:transcriptional regulator with XRE-family HTH domain